MTAPATADERPGADTSAASWVFTGLVLVAMLITTWIRRGDAQYPGALLIAFAVVAWSPLLVRTRQPLVALAGTVVLESLHLVVVPDIDPGTVDAGIRMGAFQPVPIATMIAAFTVASRVPRWLGWSAGVAAGAILMVVGVLSAPPILLATDLVMFNLVLIATATGVAVATRGDRIRREAGERVASTRQAVLDERLRIARELHDVLAHNLTLLNAQASVAEYLVSTDPAAAATALKGMSVHSARAIDELRSAVGLLRQAAPDDATPQMGPDLSRSPAPGMADVQVLVDTVRAAGSAVTLTVAGDPRGLSEMVDLAAYRIVQEALTNATRHAPGMPVRVVVGWSSAGLELQITTPVAPVRDGHRGTAAGTGHGLIGMRERADAAGGRLEEAGVVDGVFTVRVVLPVGARAIENAYPDGGLGV